MTVRASRRRVPASMDCSCVNLGHGCSLGQWGWWVGLLVEAGEEFGDDGGPFLAFDLDGVGDLDLGAALDLGDLGDAWRCIRIREPTFTGEVKRTLSRP